SDCVDWLAQHSSATADDVHALARVPAPDPSPPPVSPGSAPRVILRAACDVEPQPVLLGLDAAGVSVHSGSSCSSESLEPSPVLEAMGVDAQRSLRVSVGWSSTVEDVDRFLDALPRVLDGLRSLRT
ncbi:MAG TPA: aminotransferase class V-fold PLP-dependent enzyme, partial [Microthrixaceae bacterium]|nr:aminotransferase class V-fold PLP-dependent enzyme [Microthrixaceae bacterium]